MVKVEIIDWCGRSYKVWSADVPRKGDDVQVGSRDNKRVRGIVSRVERTVDADTDYVAVYISDNEKALNEDSSFQEVNWW